MILARQQIQELAGAGRPDRPAARIGTVAVITSDRPDSMAVCLSSLVEHTRRFGRECEFLVCDDSHTAEARSATRAAVARAAARLEVPVFYAGMEERKAYGERLVAAGLAPDLVAYLLSGLPGVSFTTGSNRNVFLIETAGQAALSSDDDAICDLFDLRKSQDAALRENIDRALEIQFFQTREEVFRHAQPVDEDLLSAHEKSLGRSPAQLLLESSGGGDIDAGAIGGRIVEDVLAGRGSVAFTMSGVAGGSTIPDETPFLLAQGVLRERFLAFWHGEPIERRSREVIAGAPQRVAGVAGSTITGPVVAFDNRALAPPFLPCSRGEDTLLAPLFSRAVPGAYLGHIPLAVRHETLPGRTYRPPRAAQSLASFIETLLHATPATPGGSAEQRFREIGRYVRERAQAPAGEFLTALASQARAYSTKVAERCDRALAQHSGQPPYWADEIRRWKERAVSNLSDPLLAAPEDLRAGRTLQEAVAVAQRHIGLFGALLEQWPDLWQAITMLRSRGRRIAEPAR